MGGGSDFHYINVGGLTSYKENPQYLKKGRKKLKRLFKDPEWVEWFTKRCIQGRKQAGTKIPNNFTMKGKKHTEETKKKISEKAKIHQKGKNNSQYDTCWIYNLELQVNKKIKKEELDKYLKDGWIKGRKMKF